LARRPPRPWHVPHSRASQASARVQVARSDHAGLTPVRLEGQRCSRLPHGCEPLESDLGVNPFAGGAPLPPNAGSPRARQTPAVQAVAGTARWMMQSAVTSDTFGKPRMFRTAAVQMDQCKPSPDEMVAPSPAERVWGLQRASVRSTAAFLAGGHWGDVPRDAACCWGLAVPGAHALTPSAVSETRVHTVVCCGGLLDIQPPLAFSAIALHPLFSWRRVQLDFCLGFLRLRQQRFSDKQWHRRGTSTTPRRRHFPLLSNSPSAKAPKPPLILAVADYCQLGRPGAVCRGCSVKIKMCFPPS